jgi:hypothetical protein
MRRFDHLADLDALAGLHYYAVPANEFESGGIKMVGLASLLKDDPYDIGH